MKNLHQTTATQPTTGANISVSVMATAEHGCLRCQYLLSERFEDVPVRLPDGTRTVTFKDALQSKIDAGTVRFVRENLYGKVYEDVVSQSDAGWTFERLMGIVDDLSLQYGGVFETLKTSAIRLLEAGKTEEARTLLTGNAGIRMRMV